MFSDSPSFLMKVVLKIINYTCQYKYATSLTGDIADKINYTCQFKYATSLTGDIAEKTQQQTINGQ
ncbi:MAG: hypothetical protein WCH52_02995 [Bacteroidota bacterium]